MNPDCYTEITGSPGYPGYPGIPSPAPPIPEIPTFRTLFTLDAYKNQDDIDGRKTNDTCQHNQMYDDVQVSAAQLKCYLFAKYIFYKYKFLTYKYKFFYKYWYIYVSIEPLYNLHNLYKY